MEEWKILEENNKYAINNKGQIINTSTMKYKKTEIHNGYERVIFIKNGKRTRHKVHRLVAKYFVPNPKNKDIVNHIDENKLNNHFSNLEWCTSQENIRHSINMKLIKEGVEPRTYWEEKEKQEKNEKVLKIVKNYHKSLNIRDSKRIENKKRTEKIISKVKNSLEKNRIEQDKTIDEEFYEKRREFIQELKNEGFMLTEISKHLGLSVSTVYFSLHGRKDRKK